MQIYLDYSATTPPRPEVMAAMQAAMTQHWGNPSSIHEWGQRSAMVVEMARSQVADLLNAATPESIIFTSSGTEADNLAIWGVVRSYSEPQHIIISSVEHSAVSQPVAFLKQCGWQVTELPVDENGRVNPCDLKNALRPNTVLVSIIYGQSEVGTLQPISMLGDIARAHGVLFHTDAVQVAGRLPLNVQELPVDLLSLSSHKIYGPQGVGALYVRQGVDLVPLLAGGGQEFKLRSGTQAVPAIVGFGVAAELAAQEMATESVRLIGLRERLFELLGDVHGMVATGDRLHRLPHHVSFCFTDVGCGEAVTGRSLVRQMNLAGVAISSGSACSSGKISPSPVLLAMGYSPPAATAAVRLTLGRQTTEADVEWTALVFKQVLGRLCPQLSLSCC